MKKQPDVNTAADTVSTRCGRVSLPARDVTGRSEVFPAEGDTVSIIIQL